jgi:hypothetical protein
MHGSLGVEVLVGEILMVRDFLSTPTRAAVSTQGDAQHSLLASRSSGFESYDIPRDPRRLPAGQTKLRMCLLLQTTHH